MSIHFGTDGWRAVISEEFTFANVRLVAQAIADWIGESIDHSQRTMVVGYDTRFLSDRYAAEVAQVLAANGIQVYLTRQDTPTPVVSHAIRHLGADGGVMVTASHNPPRYNGLKLKVASGGSASGADCKRVEKYLQRESAPRTMEFAAAEHHGLIRRFDPVPAYSAHLETMLNCDTIASHPGRVAIDSMHGAGRGHIQTWLQSTGWEVEEIHSELNPGFGGFHPEPIMPHLQALQKMVLAGRFSLGLATDGDADRIGAIDERGRFVSPQSIFALALRYLVEDRNLRGTVVRSISMTNMIDRLCARYRLPIVETPVGFSHIAKLMADHDVLIGGEESGGITLRGHVPVGDGILLGLLLLEIVSSYGTTLAELLDDLQATVGPAFYARQDLTVPIQINKHSMTERLSQNVPQRIGEFVVEHIQLNDGLKYLLRNGAWLLIRPSGTEPVLRIYAEAPEQSGLSSLLDYGRSIAASVA
ncbi:MAG: phosphoglucomutase/phosphomannomutase family protein [Litorilinea sp.]